jgi:hypothetical protein
MLLIFASAFSMKVKANGPKIFAVPDRCIRSLVKGYETVSLAAKHNSTISLLVIQDKSIRR